MKKKGSLVPILVGLLVVAAVAGVTWFAWTLLGGASRNTGDAAAPAPSEAKPADASLSAAAESSNEAKPAATPTRDLEAMPKPPLAPPLESAMPASYRRALSGVRGRLVEADGKPAANLAVELVELLPSAALGEFASLFAGAPPKFPELSVAKGRSGADGVFTLEGTHGNAMHAVGVDLGGPRATLRVVDRSLPTATVVDLGDIALDAFVTFRGKIADEDGKPIAGARVRATILPPIVFQPGVADIGRAVGLLPRQGGSKELIEFPDGLRAWESRLPLPTTKSGDDGTFELKGVPQGLATLVADHDGYCGAFKGPTPTGKRDRDVGTIALTQGVKLRGVVVDPAGQPISGVEVFGGVEISVARMAILFKAPPTGADGRFEIDHLSESAGALLIAARATPLQPPTIQNVEDPAHDVTVTLPGACSLGVSLKHADGTPVTDSDVELWLNPMPDVPLLSFAAPHRVPAAQIEKIGEGHVTIHGLAAGNAELFGRVAGLARTSLRCDVTAEVKEVTLKFVPATTLAVRVVDATTNAPIEWANVEVSADRRHEAPLVARRTDATGAAQLPELPADGDAKLRIHVAHPAYAPQIESVAPSAAGATPIVFSMRPGAAIHGHAHVGGGPITEPVLITFESRATAQGVADDEFPRLAVPGLDGTFELKGLAPGRVNWEVIPRVFGGDVFGAVEKAMSMMQTLRRGSLDLVEGQTAELDIDLDPSIKEAPGKLTGLVHVRSGRRPEMFELNVTSQQIGSRGEVENKVFQVRSEQRFSFDVTAGWINLSITEAAVHDAAATAQPFAAGLQIYQSWFQLEPGQSHDIPVEIEVVQAKVSIVDDTGQPVPHAGVNIHESRVDAKGDASGVSSNQWVQSGDDGMVDVELPRPGRWHFLAQSQTAGKGDADFTFPSTRTERITLARGIPCSGRIEITNDPGGDGEYYLQFQHVAEDTGYYFDAGNSAQLSKGERNFNITGLGPGKYRASLYGQRWSRDQVEVVLPEVGRRDLVLRFKLEDPSPKQKDE